MSYADATLRAYLDGALPVEEAAALEAALEGDPDLERRMMALDFVAAPVRHAMETVPDPARLGTVMPEVAEPAPFRGLWALGGGLAGAAIAAGVALVLVTSAPLAPTLDWRHEVARYQALYVPETVAHLDADPGLLDKQLDRASAAVGLDLQRAALDGLDGLELRRAQVLGFVGQPLVQMVYAAADGTPIAFCLMAGDDGVYDSETRAGLASVAWGSGDHQFLLIGGDDASQLGGVAKMLQDRGFGTG